MVIVLLVVYVLSGIAALTAQWILGFLLINLVSILIWIIVKKHFLE